MENTLDSAEVKKTIRTTCFCHETAWQVASWTFFFYSKSGAKKSNWILKLGGILFPLQPRDKKESFMPRLWQWSQISLKSVAAFKEQSSGKLVEPAGNKIQADLPPLPPSLCTM